MANELAAYETLIDFANDGVQAATVESGATPRVAGQFANFNAAEIVAGATNLSTNPVFGNATPGNGYTLTRITVADTTKTDHPLASFGITTVEQATSTGSFAYHRKSLAGLTPGDVYMGVVIWRAKQGAGGVPYDNARLGNMAGSLADGDLTWKIVADTWTVPAGGTVDVDAYVSWLGGAGKVNEIAYFGIINLTTAGLTGLSTLNFATFNLATHGIYVIAGNMGTGYSWSGTAHASNSVRAVGKIALTIASQITPTSGALIAKLNPHIASTAAGLGAFTTVAAAIVDANNYIELDYRKSTASWRLTRCAAGVSTTLSLADTFAADAAKCVYAAWNATTLYLATGGGAISSTADAHIPASLPTTLYIGSRSDGTQHFNARHSLVMLFDSPIVADVWTYFAALTRPSLFGELVGRTMSALWIGDETVYYDDARDIVGSDVYDFECQRGRSYASQLTGRSEAGTYSATLRNVDGRYSPDNASGALYGLLLPGRKLRVRAADATQHYAMWAGFLDEIALEAGMPPIARITAKGPMIRLSGNRIGAVAYNSGALTGTIMTAILAAAGLAASDYTVEAGQTTTARWYSDNRGALEAAQEIEETELGFLYETDDNRIGFHDRHHRLLTAASLISQATYSDAAGAAKPYLAIQPVDSWREIFNDVRVEIQKFSVASAAVLWTLQGETPTLLPGQSKTFEAVYPSPAVGGVDGAYVDTWTTPVVGTDVTQTGVANGDIGISTVKTSNAMQITITNNHASATATLTLVQARGTAVTVLAPSVKRSSDSASQTKYGTKSFTLPAKWLANTNDGQDYGDYVVSRYKDRHPVLSLVLNGSHSAAMLADVLTRDLSDRVTVTGTGFKTKLGISEDFFVESIKFAVSRRRVLTVTLTLSSVGGDGAYWIVGTSQVGTTTKVGY